MDWNQISASWHEYSGAAKAYWGQLTDDDLKVIGGKREQLIGKLQSRYGLTAEQAEQEVENWLVRTLANVAPALGNIASRAARPAGRVAGYFGDAVGNAIRRNAATCLLTTAAVAFLFGALWHRIVR